MPDSRKAKFRPEYDHSQRSPLCVLLYLMVAAFLVTGIVLWREPVIRVVFPVVAVACGLLAASMQFLRVRDAGQWLEVAFGPLPLFRRRVPYDQIESVAQDRTTLLEGLGIHWSLRGGWVWNIWGSDCVALHLTGGRTLRIGTDQPAKLYKFLQSKIESPRG